MFSVNSPNAEHHNDWEEVSNQNHIRIFTRHIPDSALIAVRGVSQLEAEVTKIGHIILDVTRYKEWVPQLKHARIIEQKLVTEWLGYLLIELPWPVTDRDVLLRFRMYTNDNNSGITFRVHSVELPSLPEHPGVVRAEIPFAEILLTGDEEGLTVLDANMQLDLKGFIPHFVSQYVIKKLPIKLIKGLRKQARKEDIVVDTGFWNSVRNLPVNSEDK